MLVQLLSTKRESTPWNFVGFQMPVKSQGSLEIMHITTTRLLHQRLDIHKPPTNLRDIIITTTLSVICWHLIPMANDQCFLPDYDQFVNAFSKTLLEIDSVNINILVRADVDDKVMKFCCSVHQFINRVSVKSLGWCHSNEFKH